MSRSSGQSGRGAPEWIWGLGLVLAVLVSYLPVAWGSFIWDDDLMVTDNGCIIGPFGLKEIWTTNAADVCPFTLTTLWAEFKLWGFTPALYHIVTVVFHACSALMLWRVLRQLAVPGAWLGAAIWALHPVQVESVAWIAETKNTESCLFFLIAIYFFIRTVPKSVDAPAPATARRDYILMLIFSVLAMTSKTSTTVLPLVLCLVAWWKQGRWSWKWIPRLAPVFALALVAALLTIAIQAAPGAEARSVQLSWPEKFIVAGISFWFYLGKLAWPNPLMILYPKWDMHPEWAVSYLPFAAVVLVGIILWLGRETWLRPAFFAYAFFAVCLLPVMGFFNIAYFHFTFVGDHFQYLASMGPLVLVGAILHRIGMSLLKERPIVRVALAAWVVLALGGMSLAYSRTFKDQVTIWTDELAKNPLSWTALNQLGAQYAAQGDNLAAVDNLQRSVELNPDDPRTQNNLGLMLDRRGETDAAMSHFQKALQIDPDYGRAHFAIANILLRQGRNDDAIQEYEHALLSGPRQSDVRIGYGSALARKGRLDEAHEQLEQAVFLNPNSPEAHFYFGNILMLQKQPKEAVEQYQTALTLRPNDPGIMNTLGQAKAAIGNTTDGVEQLKAATEKDPNSATLHLNLARMYKLQDKPDETIAQVQEALKISPDNAQAHDLLASALVAKGKVDEAVAEYRKAIELDPKFPQAYADLGFVLFGQGKAKEAIGLYNRAVELNPNDAGLHNNLGIIYAEAGQFPQARAQFAAALKIDPNSADAKRNVQRLEAMAAGKANPAPAGK